MFARTALLVIMFCPVIASCNHGATWHPQGAEGRLYTAPGGPTPRILARDLVKADPVRDLDRALASGDKRFIGVATFTKYAPGLEYRREITEKYGMKFMEDLTDTSGPDEATVEQAIEYAEIYNLMLFRTLRQRGEVQWTSINQVGGNTGEPNTASQPSSNPVPGVGAGRGG